jgi:hypothetical protein
MFTYFWRGSTAGFSIYATGLLSKSWVGREGKGNSAELYAELVPAMQSNTVLLVEAR